MGPWDGRRAEGEVAEEPVWGGGASAAGWEGIRRSEKAKVPRKALVTGGSKVERPVTVRKHTYTKSQTYCDGRKTEGRQRRSLCELGGVRRRSARHKAK